MPGLKVMMIMSLLLCVILSSFSYHTFNPTQNKYFKVAI